MEILQIGGYKVVADNCSSLKHGCGRHFSRTSINSVKLFPKIGQTNDRWTFVHDPTYTNAYSCWISVETVMHTVCLGEQYAVQT